MTTCLIKAYYMQLLLLLLVVVVVVSFCVTPAMIIIRSPNPFLDYRGTELAHAVDEISTAKFMKMKNCL